MGIFGFFKSPDINAGIDEYRTTPGAVLLDVRTAEEYADGHIPGSVNLPVDHISEAAKRFNRNAPIYTYCHSGARSQRATKALQRSGFTQVHNIGGISDYRGQTER